MENKPISDAALAELDRLHAAAPSGKWVVGKNKASGRIQVHNGQHQVCAIWHTTVHPASQAAEYIAALHNAIPGLVARLELAEAYRTEVEAARPTVQALLDSGEVAAGEVADLRLRLAEAEARLAEAERKRDTATDDEAGYWIGIIRSLDPENLCDVFDGLGFEENLRQWLAARDARMKREGAAEWLGWLILAHRAERPSDPFVPLAVIEQSAQRLREEK